MGIKRYNFYVFRLDETSEGELEAEETPKGEWVRYEDHVKEMQERVLDAYIKGTIDGAFEGFKTNRGNENENTKQ